MTKKKFLAVLSTAAITTSMLVTPAFANEWNSNGGESEQEASVEIRQPVVEVELPETVAFTLNPYKLNLSDSENAKDAITAQIWSDNYLVVNNSEIPVAVDIQFTPSGNITVLDEIELNDAGTDVKYASANDKAAFFGVQFAKTIAFKDDAYAVTANTFDPTKALTEANFTGAGGVLFKDLSTAQTVSVLLDSNAETNIKSGKNAASFKYVGTLNSASTSAYEDGDLGMTVKYTLTLFSNGAITKNLTAPGYGTAAAAGTPGFGGYNVGKKD